MLAYAAYIISIDGRPLVSVNFQSSDSIPDNMLLGGLLTAIQYVATEISNDKSELKTIKIENLTYHFKSFGFFRVVLVTDQDLTPENVIHKIGWRFMKKYGEKVMDIGVINDSDFNSFKNVIQEIITEDLTIDESSRINPTKKINTSEIYLLESTLQQTAIALIALREGSINEISQESGLPIDLTSLHIHQLQEKGLVGTKSYEGVNRYFCSI